MPEILFKEVQRHNQLLFRFIISITAIFPIFYFGWIFIPEVLTPLLKHQTPKDIGGNLISIFCSIIFGGGIILISRITKLETIIDNSGIKVRYFPFMIKFKEILAEEIESFHIKKYFPLAEFGGWGARIALNGNRAYIASGNIGMQLEIKNGKSILIGTGKPDSFNEALEKLFKKFNFVNKFSK